MNQEKTLEQKQIILKSFITLNQDKKFDYTLQSQHICHGNNSVLIDMILKLYLMRSVNRHIIKLISTTDYWWVFVWFCVILKQAFTIIISIFAHKINFKKCSKVLIIIIYKKKDKS